MKTNSWKKSAFQLLWVTMLISGPTALAYGVYNQEWVWLIGALLMTPIVGGGLGIDIAMHRYLSHRSFSTTKFKHYILSILAFLSAQGSAVNYAGIHRHHHKHSDTERDIHSPHYQSLFSVNWLLWQLQFTADQLDNKVKMGMRDLMNDPVNRWLDRWYYHIWVLILTVGVLISWKVVAFLLVVPIWKGYVESYITNTLMHMKSPGSYRNFETADQSQNLHWYTWLCFGQGMHNNHHAFPGAYHLKMKPHDIDFAGDFIEKFLIEKNPNKVYNF